MRDGPKSSADSQSTGRWICLRDDGCHMKTKATSWQEEHLRGQAEQRGSKYLSSPATFMLWPSRDCPFISDPLARCFWSMLDFQGQRCMSIIRGRDEQKQLCLSPDRVWGVGHRVMKNAAAVR